jgi:hypothetical protein
MVGLAGLPLAPAPSPDISSQPGCVRGFIELTGSQRKNSLSRVFLAGGEIEAVKFEEQNPNHEPGSLVAIDEGMVADNPSGVKRRHFDDVGSSRISVVLAGPGESRVQKPSLAQSRGTAMQR